jgi:hypothetical protein
LLYETVGDLLLLPCVGGGTVMHAGHILGLACGSHDGKEGLLPPLCGGYDSLCRNDKILLHSLFNGGNDLLLLEREAGGGEVTDAIKG